MFLNRVVREFVVGPEKFHVLLLERPDLCERLLEIMAERVTENTDMLKAMLKRDKQPEQRSVVV